MVINTIIAKHPYALRDAVELDMSSVICNVPQSIPLCAALHLSHFTSIQDGSSCKL